MKSCNEIERKYVIVDHSWLPLVTKVEDIVQGYLLNHCINPSAYPSAKLVMTNRVRIIDGKQAYFAAKMDLPTGIDRFEVDHEIDMGMAKALLDLSAFPVLCKKRFTVPLPNSALELTVDVFTGDNEGLIIGEIEFEDSACVPPAMPFLGCEIEKGTILYHATLNSTLATKPFSSWSTAQPELHSVMSALRNTSSEG